MPQTSAVDSFFEGLPSQDKPLADIFAPETKEVPAAEKPAEEVDESVKNRRHKRLETQLRESHEMNIALNERVKVLSEVEKFAKETRGVDADIAKLFDASDMGKQNALILSTKLSEMKKEAREEAIEAFREEQRTVVQEQKKLESYIDSQFESLEDTYGVDLTSDAPAARKARREFGELLEKVSPKDKNGEIKEYADFNSTFELYKSSQTVEQPSRNKEIASRTMQRSGTVDSSKQNQDAQLQYLRSIGVNV